MDVDEALKEIRNLVARNKEGRPAWGDHDRLCELVESVDDWLSNGGFYPIDWKEGRGAQGT